MDCKTPHEGFLSSVFLGLHLAYSWFHLKLALLPAEPSPQRSHGPGTLATMVMSHWEGGGRQMRVRDRSEHSLPNEMPAGRGREGQRRRQGWIHRRGGGFVRSLAGEYLLEILSIPWCGKVAEKGCSGPPARNSDSREARAPREYGKNKRISMRLQKK